MAWNRLNAFIDKVEFMTDTTSTPKMKSLKLSIYRYHPETDDKPTMQDFTVEIPADVDMMLLSVLIKIKEEQDETLSFRRSCREGVCGSDGMNINGRNGLACVTSIANLKQPIVVRPFPGFPVERDLIVNMDQFYRQYEKIEPWLQNDEAEPGRERLQSPEERKKLDGLYECILCGCCSSSCPSYWWNPDKFIGPAGLLQANRFIQDSRDNQTAHRLEALGDPYKLFRCRSIMNCVDACPKGLNPTKAIAAIREKQIDEGS
jgi:succinate dehydrogenase / fumarate reductase, iron-sulfur subunit